MRGPERWAVAVRRPNGEIYVEENPTTTLAQKYPGLNRFLLRGIFALVDSLIIGIKSLTISAGIALERLEDGESPGQAASEGQDRAEAAPGERKVLGTVETTVALIIALALFLGLFIVVPAVLARALDQYLSNTVLYNLFEGFLRLTIFVLYLVAISRLPDVKRMFAYHGAEHKVVHAYEAGLPLTEGSARQFSTAHMRCGTAFIVIVFVISILAFSLLGRPALWLRIVERLAIIPLVAAVAYEIIRLAGKRENSRLVRTLLAPGLWLQRITTREPDADQIEVAIRALEAALGEVTPPADRY